MSTASTGFAAAGRRLWTCGGSLKNLCRILAVGNGLLNGGNIRGIRCRRCDGDTMVAIPVAVAAEIQRFSIRESESDGSVSASFNLLAAENFIALNEQASCSIW